MQMMSALIAVKDIEASKQFYTKLLGMKITQDLGENVTLDNKLSLQELQLWATFLDTQPDKIRFGGRQMELYFEVEDIGGFCEELAQSWPQIKIAHPLTTYPWGQQSVHFYDPDEHLVEVGQSMKSVVKGCLVRGMSLEDTQKQCQYSMAFMQMCKRELEEEGKL